MKIYLISALLLPFLAYSEVNTNLLSKFNQIVDAIYVIENSSRYPYGVKSIECNGNKEKSRRICFNTVRNNYFRWQKSNKSLNYLEFLQRRYCPIGASDDPKNLNSNWLKNLKNKLGRDFRLE